MCVLARVRESEFDYLGLVIGADSVWVWLRFLGDSPRLWHFTSLHFSRLSFPAYLKQGLSPCSPGKWQELKNRLVQYLTKLTSLKPRVVVCRVVCFALNIWTTYCTTRVLILLKDRVWIVWYTPKPVCISMDSVAMFVLLQRAFVSSCHLFISLIVFPPFQMFCFCITDS